MSNTLLNKDYFRKGRKKMRNYMKTTVGLVGAGVLAITLAACSTGGTNAGDNSSPSSSSSSSSSSMSKPTPVASVKSLTGVDTQVKVDAGFLSALQSLGVTPGVEGTAKLTDGTLSFPITGGNVDYYDPAQDYRPYVQGEIDHNGSGLTLTAGDTKVELSDFKIDPGTSRLTGTVKANGETVGENVFLFNLDGTTLKPLQANDDGTAVLEGTRVLISKDAAPLLNKTFKTDAIKADMLVGIAKITVNTK
jgi:uncharacterized lipoprotein YmbA